MFIKINENMYNCLTRKKDIQLKEEKHSEIIQINKKKTRKYSHIEQGLAYIEEISGKNL
jgi:hypothetical protein